MCDNNILQIKKELYNVLNTKSPKTGLIETMNINKI